MTQIQAAPRNEVPMTQTELDNIMDELMTATAGAIPPTQAAVPQPVIQAADMPDAGTHTSAIPEYTEGMKPIEPLPWEESSTAPIITEGPLAQLLRDRQAAGLIPADRLPAVAAVVAKGPVPTQAPVLTPVPTQPPVLTPAPTAAPVAPVVASVQPAANAPLLHIVVPNTVVAAPVQAPVPAPKGDGPAPLNTFGIDEAAFRRDSVITDAKMDDMFRRQAADFSHYAAVAARADAQAATCKKDLEIVEASLFKAVREQLLAGEGGKATEKLIDASVKTQRKYVTYRQRFIDAELIADLARVQSNAMLQRKDSLVQLGADRREEMKGQMRMRG